MKNELHTLFVYGSLRQGFQNPAYEYMSRYFTLLGNAKVKGHLYDLGSFPAAKPTEEDAWIVGELYRINSPAEFSWAIAQIDDYEGLVVEADEQPLYRRDSTTAVLADGSSHPSWVYWYNGDVAGKPLVPSGDILVYLRERGS
jgi:gamma-glutamylcyclotransferase (GGCT)/AIG2-like uncharacterized protein YtfP